MGIQERRDREKTIRRDQILDAALKVFQKSGWTDATMDQVAEEAELAKGTLYLYFKDKEEIYAGLGARGMSGLADEFKKIADTVTPACLAMRKIGEEYHRHFLANSVYMASNHYGIHKLSQCDCEPDSEMAKMHEAGVQCLSYVAEIIRKGIDAGEFIPTIDPMQTAVVFWSFSDGIMTHQLWEERTETSLFNVDMTETVWVGFRLLMKGIMTDSTIQKYGMEDRCQ